MGFRRPNQAGGDQWGFYTSNFIATRPSGSNSSFGVTVTPGASNTKGAYAQVLTALAQDVFMLRVDFNGGAASAALRDMICDVGVDPAGGTSYTVLIPDLLGTGSNFTVTGFGFTYWFPLKIKAGSTVAVRAAVNNATAGAMRANISAWGAPRDPRAIRYGTGVRAYGITAASSQGTAVTPGQAAEGSYATLGTVAAGDYPWWWQSAGGFSNTNVTALNYHLDMAVGDGSSRKVVIQDQRLQPTTSEGIWVEGIARGCEYRAKPGDIVEGRAQCSGVPDSNFYMAAWGVVG